MTRALATDHDVLLQPSGWRFTASPAVSLLQAAAAAMIRLPAACRNGTCRTCLCRAQGPVTYPADVRPGLTPEERDEGWILPCVARAAGTVTLQVPGASPREVRPPAGGLTGARR